MRPILDIATKSLPKGMEATSTPTEKRSVQIASIKEPFLKRPFDIFLSLLGWLFLSLYGLLLP